MKITSSIIRDTIEIMDERGDVVREFPFTFNVVKSFARVQDLRVEILKQNTAGNMEALGHAVYDLFCAIFGDENAAAMNEYYDGDYVTMLNDLTPVILEVVYPAVDRVAQQMKDAHKRAKAKA